VGRGEADPFNEEQRTLVTPLKDFGRSPECSGVACTIIGRIRRRRSFRKFYTLRERDEVSGTKKSRRKLWEKGQASSLRAKGEERGGE